MSHFQETEKCDNIVSHSAANIPLKTKILVDYVILYHLYQFMQKLF